MKVATVLFLSLAFRVAYAGSFIEKGAYVQTHLAIGKGQTVELARKDAIKEMPKGYIADSENNSPAIQCEEKKFIWNEETECQNSYVEIFIPVRRIR